MPSTLRQLRYGWHYLRLVGPRQFMAGLRGGPKAPDRVPWYRPLVDQVGSKRGLEIGGPSAIFRAAGPLPLYPYLATLDVLDFAARTLWSGGATSDRPGPMSGLPPGRKIVADATGPTGLGPAGYDLLLSSHVLEHIANPIRALREWSGWLRPDGRMVTVVPEGARMFDHARPATTLDHFRADLARGVTEDDLSHLEEVLRLHDLALDPGVRDASELAERSRRNLEFRSLHHHVFTPDSLLAVLTEGGFATDGVDRIPPFHLVALSRAGGAS